MLLPLLVPYRRRRKVPKSAGVAPPPVGISVMYVAPAFHNQPGKCVWVFSRPVTLTGVPTGLRVQVDGVWLEPSSAIVVGTTGQEIQTTYATTQGLLNKAWSIATTPTGIAEAGEITVPEEGTVGAE